jgi:hypothetical protein
MYHPALLSTSSAEHRNAIEPYPLQYYRNFFHPSGSTRYVHLIAAAGLCGRSVHLARQSRLSLSFEPTATPGHGDRIIHYYFADI